jgi:hypothetical protein
MLLGLIALQMRSVLAQESSGRGTVGSAVSDPTKKPSEV